MSSTGDREMRARLGERTRIFLLTVKMVRGNECSKAKKLCDSHSRLDEAVLVHLLTFVIRARQRPLELDDCLASPAPPRRRRRTGGATWVDVQCGCERLRHELENPNTLYDAQPPCAVSGIGSAGRRALSFYAKVFLRKVPHDNRLDPVPPTAVATR